MLPIFLLKKEGYFKLEPEETPTIELPNLSYVVAKGGIFQRNFNTGHKLIKKAEEVPTLEALELTSSCLYPIISYDVYRKTLEFLRRVYNEHKSEGCVLLLLNRNIPLSHQAYTIYIPKQKCTSAHVSYEIDYNEIPNDFYVAGSIHSHPSFGASQSSTDHKDEFQFDGVHITFGNIEKPTPDINQRVCMVGGVYETKTSMIQTTPEEEQVEIPIEWMNKIEKDVPMQNIHHGWGRDWNKNWNHNNWSRSNFNNSNNATKNNKLKIIKHLKTKKITNQKNVKELTYIVEGDLCLISSLLETVE